MHRSVSKISRKYIFMSRYLGVVQVHILLLGELAFGVVGTRLGLELSRADQELTHAASLGSDEESISPRGRSSVEE